MANFSTIETAENYVHGGPLEMVRRTIKNGGGTFKIVIDHRGVAIYDMAKVEILPDFRGSDVWIVGGVEGRGGEVLLGREVETIREMIRAGYDSEAPSRREQFLGTWIDPKTGIMYVDCIDFHMHESDALKVARVRGELAIYNLATDETVHMDAVSWG